MSEKIKELLEELKNDINIKENWQYVNDYYVEDMRNLLDYIEDLQQKVEEKDKEIDKLKNQVVKLNEQVSQYQDEIFARDNNWYDMQD